MTGEIVAIDVRPAEQGIAGPRAGVQDLVRPRIYGRLAEDGRGVLCHRIRYAQP